MNIFALDADPKLSAQYHVDSHVNKMLIEYAQLMSTAHVVTKSPISHQVYAPTHVNHPSGIWTRMSVENYEWLYSMWSSLHDEFCHRRGKAHATFLKLCGLLKNVPVLPEDTGLTPVLLAMPDSLKDPTPVTFQDAVDRYRLYYSLHKQHLHKWSKRKEPSWLIKP